jgi:outer membrane protein assembly factor BamB
VNGNVLYVTNNYQNSNGDFYISTYTADTGALINANFIQIPTGGLYGLALKNNVFGVNSALYVSVYSGNAPGVYTYNATTGQLIKGPFVSVKEPYGIAIGGNTLNTLYVASYQDSAIYEFDATTGQLTGSIKLSGAPTNITVEPATNQ